MYVEQKQQFKGGILNKCCIVKRSYFLFLGKSSNVDSFHFHRAVCHVTHSEARWPVRTILVFQFFLKVAWIQSYEIKSRPWTILWFRILGIFSVENIDRLCVLMFQTWDNSQLLIDS